MSVKEDYIYMKLIGIGDNVCDVYLNMSEMFPGGQAMNVAVFAKEQGVKSAFMGVFGDDEVAAHNQKILSELGVDHSHCRHYHGANGFACVNLIDGERVFLGSNKCGVLRDFPLILTNDDLTYISQFSVAHISNNAYFDDQIEKLFKLGIPISYDFSNQWINNIKWLESIAQFCTFGFLSLPDDSSLKEIREYMEQIHSFGCKMIIATNGSKGAYFYDGKSLIFQPSNYVKAIDTLGAGDSYASTILVNYFKSLEDNLSEMSNDYEYYVAKIKNAMEKAASFSANVCLCNGAFGHSKKINPDKYKIL